MEFDALRAGVNGGLVTKESIKLLICYIINNIGEPLPQNEFSNEMHADGIANYFELSEAFSDLTKKELIAECPDKSGYFILTPVGLSTVNELKENIPYTVRKKAFIATVKMLRRMKYQEQTVVKTERTASGEYVVTCSIIEGEKEMMTVKLNVPDFETAQLIKNNFWDSPEQLYSKVISFMTNKKFEYTDENQVFLDK